MSVSVLPETPTEPRRRSRALAVMLSLIAPGSGHVYGGRARRGVLLYGAVIASQAIMIAATVLISPRFTAIVTFIGVAAVVPFAIYLFCAFDAARLAKRPGAPPRWYVVIGAVIAVWLCSVVAGELIGRTKPLLPWRLFSVPSSSMEPTLRVGEQFVSDMTYFRQHSPARGDVIVYRLPKDPGTIYVKRIVALAGDRVVFREGRAFVNGAAVAEPYINAGHMRSMFNNTQEFTVRAEHVFVAGDNRANSTDSRVTAHGFVPVGNIIGRASEIFWSNGTGREGTWVGSPG
jgi:signal peptidase I